MKYIAFDQSLKTTGYAIYHDNSLQIVNKFTIPSNKPIDQRLNLFFQQLNDLCYEHQFEHVFFEDIQLQHGNAETYKKLAMIQAMVIFWCYNNDMPYTILPPSHWRKIIKDNYKVTFGRARVDQKKAAKQFVKEKFGLDISEDECDAICIGLAGIQERGKNVSAF